MPQHSLEEAKLRLHEALTILDSRIANLNAPLEDYSLRDRLIIAREGVRQAIRNVEHAEEAITGG